MNELISSDYILKVINLEKFGGKLITRVIMQLLKINEINDFYRENFHRKPIEFIDSMIAKGGIKYEIDDNELKNIPVTNAFFTVSNHPYGGLDGVLLLKILSEKRVDFKIMANICYWREYLSLLCYILSAVVILTSVCYSKNYLLFRRLNIN